MEEIVRSAVLLNDDHHIFDLRRKLRGGLRERKRRRKCRQKGERAESHVRRLRTEI